MYPQINFRFIFVNNRTIGSFFRVKDVIPASLKSGICYQYTCTRSGCSSGYVGLSTRRLHTRIQEHVGVSPRTLNPIARPLHSQIREHSEEEGHPFSSDNFKIIGRASNELDLRILESLAIKTENSTLNMDGSSIELFTV